jgi:peroxiredoxin (alkyl hydroperoxide reductase subunit C)
MDDNVNRTTLPLIGDPAPAFTAVTTNGTIHFPEDYQGKWVILFSHPSDFTPVCSTEFMTFASMQSEFDTLNTHLLGLSIDSVAAHTAWIKSLESLTWKDIKKPVVNFPVIADLSMDVARKYGMIQSSSSTSAVRAVFIIDPKGIVRLIMYYPASTGRNFAEIKRVVQALQKADNDKCATPADWLPGDDIIDPNPGTKEGCKERYENPGSGRYCLDWYLCFRKENTK